MNPATPPGSSSAIWLVALAFALVGSACVEGVSIVGELSGRDATVPSDIGVVDGSVDVVTDVPEETPPDVPFHCQTNADCAGNAAGAVCDTFSGACVQCAASADTCPVTEHCNPASSICVPGCRSDDGCLVTGDAGAPDAGVAANHCDTATNTCVQCVGDGQCAPGTVCVSNACQPGCAADQLCPAGLTCCGAACADLQTDPMRCGGCAIPCMAVHDAPGCVAGACTVGTCASGFADCDGLASTGCEVETQTDVSNCGACGDACVLSNASPACMGGVCAVASCNGTFADCDGIAANGCEVDTSSSTAACGTCGTECHVAANAVTTCTAGACGFICSAGFADCDAMAVNGCEVNTRSDANNCGACGAACALGQGCTSGTCQFGSGSSGPLTVSATTILNLTSAVISGAAGTTSITLISAAGVLAVGQEVFLHQSQAATGPVGQYEFARVTAVAGSLLTVATPLRNNYVSAGSSHAQLIVVPQYTTVSIAAGGILTAPAWNGATGGILVFDTSGVVHNAGSIVMDTLGFRGVQHGACGTHCVAGQSGESSVGVGVVASASNGAGGGGGAAGQDCGSGGGGGYGTAGVIGLITTCGTCATCNVAGSAGVIAGAADLAGTLLFGAAGGEGGHDEDGGNAGKGGNGGGIIVMRAAGLANTGTISSAGQAGGTGDVLCGGGSGMGGGGGGAGGSIRVVAATIASLGSAQVSAGGGAGGACSSGGHLGGSGSVGRIGILAPTGSVTGTTSPAFDPE